MRLTLVLLIASFLQVQAYEGWGQENVTLSFRDAPLQDVFVEIYRQTGYHFAYERGVIEKARLVSIDVNNMPVMEALKLCFERQPFTYKVQGKIIILKDRQQLLEKKVTDTSAPVTIDVNGRVVNEKGEPVEGVTVRVKGQSKGTSTNAKGEFTLSKVNENVILLFTHVSMEDLGLKVNAKKNLVVRLKARMSELTNVEVINTGYQKLKPNENTGSVAHINNKLLNRAVTSDVLTRLQGMASGLLFVNGTENYIQQRGNIVIRGYSTIHSNRQPLIVIDNFPYEGDINSINPNDIESITVLKDAAAASIWGSRAGNGVIVITSKTGKLNQSVKVSFNSNVSITEKPDLSYVPTLPASDFIDVETFLFNNGKYEVDITSASMPALTPVVEILLKRRNGEISPEDSAAQIDALRNYNVKNDLLRYFIRKPVTQRYSVNVSGGGANQMMYLSVGYDNSIFTSSDYSRITVNLANTQYLLGRKMEVTTRLTASQTKARNYIGANPYYPYGRSADEYGNPLPIALRRQGFIDTAGAGKLLDWTYYPLKERNYTDESSKGNNFSLDIQVNYKFFKSFTIDFKGQYRREKADSRNFYSLQTYYARDLINSFTNLAESKTELRNPVPIGGILDQRNNVLTSKYLRGQINYQNSNNSVHRISGMVGAEISNTVIAGINTRFYGYDDEIGTSVPVDFVHTYPDYITGSKNKIPNNQSFVGLNNRFVSFFGNASYSYKLKYLAYISARNDGSNIFGTSTNNKWKPLWSIGASWTINREHFFDIHWLSQLKLRASYGFQGNVNNGIPAVLTITHITNLNRWNLGVASILNPPNQDLRWEKVEILNTAIDFALKNERISGTIEWYVKNGKDLIADDVLPPSLGFGGDIKTNSANVQGSGIDIVINTSNLKGKMNWRTTFQFSYTRNKVTKYKAKLSIISPYIKGTQTPIVGDPLNSLYSLKWAGLDPATGDPQGYLNGEVSKNYSAILSSTNFSDMVYNGPKTAPYFGSMLNSIQWNQLSVSFNIIYKFGYYFRRPTINYDQLFSGLDKGHSDYSLRWRKAGDESITTVPSMIYPSDPNRDIFYSLSEVLVEKGDHVRLQDIRFTYDFNKKGRIRIPFQNLQLYMNISNVAILWRTNNAELDPDYYIGSANYGAELPGKTLSAGLRIDF